MALPVRPPSFGILVLAHFMQAVNGTFALAMFAGII
jgi:hypothetical protein